MAIASFTMKRLLSASSMRKVLQAGVHVLFVAEEEEDREEEMV